MSRGRCYITEVPWGGSLNTVVTAVSLLFLTANHVADILAHWRKLNTQLSGIFSLRFAVLIAYCPSSWINERFRVLQLESWTWKDFLGKIVLWSESRVRTFGTVNAIFQDHVCCSYRMSSKALGNKSYLGRFSILPVTQTGATTWPGSPKNRHHEQLPRPPTGSLDSPQHPRQAAMTCRWRFPRSGGRFPRPAGHSPALGTPRERKRQHCSLYHPTTMPCDMPFGSRHAVQQPQCERVRILGHPAWCGNAVLLVCQPA